MNNNDLHDSSQNTNGYHATYNLNTEIENQQGEFNDAMNVNIANNNVNSNFDDNYSGSFQNNPQSVVNNQSQFDDSNFDSNVNSVSSFQNTEEVPQFDPTAVNKLDANSDSSVYSNPQQMDSVYESPVSSFQNTEGVSQFDSTAVNNVDSDSSVYSNPQQMNSVYESPVSSFEGTNSSVGNTFIPTMANQDEFSTQNYVAENESDSSASYQPVMDNNGSQEKFKVNLSKEIIFMFTIVLALVLFLLLMPYIYDFISNISFDIGR